MPRPPRVDDFTKINFITNYFFSHCRPNFWLFCEFAKPATQDLALMLFTLDLDDIVQGVFQPRGARKAKPARHGKKKRRIPGIPDWSDMMANRVRGDINPHDAINFGPTRAFFRIWNAYEAVSFSAAVLEGVTNIGFEGILGVVTHDPSRCPQFGVLLKHAAGDDFILGLIQYWNPMSITIIDQEANFLADSPFHTNTSRGAYTIGYSCEVIADGGDAEGVELGLINPGSGLTYSSGKRNFRNGSRGNLSVSGEFQAGQQANWVGHCDRGQVRVRNQQVFAFVGTWF